MIIRSVNFPPVLYIHRLESGIEYFLPFAFSSFLLQMQKFERFNLPLDLSDWMMSLQLELGTMLEMGCVLLISVHMRRSPLFSPALL